MRIISYIIVFLYSINSFCQSNDFNVVASKHELLIGEPVQLLIELKVPSSINSESIKFPTYRITDSLDKNWEIWEVDTLMKSTIQDNQGAFFSVWKQKIEIATFDTGHFELPPMLAIIGNDSIESEILNFTVTTVKIEENAAIKKIKDIKLYQLTTWDHIQNWLSKYWWIIGIIILIGITFILIYLKFKTNKTLPIVGPSIPFPDTLLTELDHIENQKLWQNDKYKIYFSLITNVLWKFIEFRYKVPTFERTSSEIIQGIEVKDISDEKLVKLKKLFASADMVKFAKQIPTQEENNFILEMTRSFIISERNDNSDINNTDK